MSYHSAFTAAFASACVLDGAERCFVDCWSVCPHAGFGGDPAVDGVGDLVDFSGRQGSLKNS